MDFTLAMRIEAKSHAINFTGIHSLLKMLGACILIFFPLWAHGQSVTPEQKVLEFYRWYISAYEHSCQDAQYNLLYDEKIEKYITTELRNEMIRKYGDPDNDFYEGVGYFLHVQDANPKWASLLDAKTVRENKGHIFVQLNINEEKIYGGTFSICVRLHRDKGILKIDQVESATQNTFSDCKTIKSSIH
jgi:hypothetical protein